MLTVLTALLSIPSAGQSSLDHDTELFHNNSRPSVFCCYLFLWLPKVLRNVFVVTTTMMIIMMMGMMMMMMMMMMMIIIIIIIIIIIMCLRAALLGGGFLTRTLKLLFEN